MNWQRWLGLALGAALWAGCNDNPGAKPQASGPAAAAATSSNTPTAADQVYYLNQALAGLPKVKLFVGAQQMEAEVCTKVQEVSTGLMHRKGIGPEEGMLFVFGEARERSFYMKNVDFDIAVAYIDADGVINEIVPLHARNETGVPSKSDTIQFVLEAAPDYFSRHGLGPGTLIACERGPLKESLARYAQVR